MTTKQFDLADWRRRLELEGSGDELLVLAREIFERNGKKGDVVEPRSGSGEPPMQGGSNKWAARYTTPRMRNMAAKALALADRRHRILTVAKNPNES